MGSVSPAGANTLLNAFAAAYPWVSIHTGNPGTTGADEVGYGTTGRQQVTWPAASGGLITWTGTLTFPISYALTALYFGLWTAQTAGTFGGGQLLAAPVTLTAAGNLVLTRIPLAAAAAP